MRRGGGGGGRGAGEPWRVGFVLSDSESETTERRGRRLEEQRASWAALLEYWEESYWLPFFLEGKNLLASLCGRVTSFLRQGDFGLCCDL